MNTHWKVRVCLPGALLHLVSRTEPVVHMREGRVADVTMTIDADQGDSIGFIDWPAVVAVTWRPSENGKS